MQNPTHLLTGILIDRIARRYVSRGTTAAIIAAGVGSHGILDRLARVTYHPPEPRTSDHFWVTYHTFLWGLSCALLAVYWREHHRGMIAASLPDADWLLREIARGLGFPWEATHEPALHRVTYMLVDRLLPPYLAAHLPRLTYQRSGAAVELALIGALLAAIARMPPPAAPQEARRSPAAE